ncbi:hypothetical protein V8F20_004967 [Naviculisporaceae sp. PSN 640]
MTSHQRSNGYTTRPLSEAHLHTIYASDQDMYPAPLTFERLRNWVDAAPDFSIALYSQSDNDDATKAGIDDTTSPPLGIIIVLPLLRKYWEDLLVGKVKEIEVEAVSMFPAQSHFTGVTADDNGAVEVGLHIFHVERFQSHKATSTTSSMPLSAGPQSSNNDGTDKVPRRQGFADIVIEEALERALSKGWKVCGFSALTATEAGKRLFRRIGYKPTGYREMFVTTANKASGKGEIKMIHEYPNSVQRHLRTVELEDDAVVSEPSEMVVRYL